MIEDRLCPACGAYQCRADDAWCGYCGEPVAQLALELRPEVLHVGEKPPRVSVKVLNASCATLSVDRIELPKWLHSRLEKTISIRPGASEGFLVEVVGRLDQTMTGMLELVTVAGSAQGCLMVIDPDPKLVCDPVSAAIWSAPGGQHGGDLLKIRPTAGRLRVLGVRMRGARISVHPELKRDGRLVGEGESLELEIGAVTGSAAHWSKTARAALEVDYMSPHGAAAASLEIELDIRQPPELHWAGVFKEPEVRRQTSDQRLRFEFRNQSPDQNDGGLRNGTLVIDSVELSAASLPGATVKRLTHLPLQLRGGATEFVEFEADLSALRGKPAELASLRLGVKSNYPSFEWDVPLKIEPMEVFGGVVAIDFGSSNSCCAVWQQGEEPALLPLDENAALVSPTIVRYMTLETTPPEIETGERVKRLAAEYAEVAASTADRLKQRLGDIRQQVSLRPETDARWVERNASEAASDYLHSIRRKAEAARGAIFQSFILTHPARCSLRQYARLRQALAHAFGAEGNQVQFLQEPIASLIGFLVERARKGGRQDYTVASFDLGGGTTDIALVRVQYDTGQPDRLRIHPKILYCRGDRFGGEDLTDFLINELSVRCQYHLFSNLGSAGPTLIGEGLAGAAELDIRRNRAEFRRIAEQFKASLSIEAASSQNREPTQIEVRVLDEGQTRTEPISFNAVNGAIGGWESLAKKFLEHTRKEISQRAGLLLAAVKATGEQLDVIQLSGKTTYLAVAAEAVASSFPGVAIERAQQPKECVVKGACLLRSLRRGSVVVELDIGDQRMTSTIGAFPLDIPYFQPILLVDQVIPPEGLTGELPLAWDGTEPVVLWEDLDGTAHRITESEASRALQRLGTWAPESERRIATGQWWTVRVHLRDFRITVEGIGPSGESVAFRPLHGDEE